MSNRKSALSVLAVWLLCIPAIAEQTALGELAARMKPGEWAELKTKNFSRALLETPGSFITSFSDDAVWDPQTQQIYFLGSGHGDRSGGKQARFIAYSAHDNAWSEIKVPSTLWGIVHSYDHNAVNQTTGEFYHRKFGNREVERYDPKSKSWTLLPPWPAHYYNAITGGLDYFPELGGLVYVNGNYKGRNEGYALLFKDNSWRELASGLDFGDFHTFIEYNPMRRVAVFGGGEWHGIGESRQMYKLDAQGKVTKLKDAPLDLGTGETIFTVDPVTGKYLVFGRNRLFWEYDVTADKWTKLSTPVPFFNETEAEKAVQGTIATPISDHCVIFFLSYHAAKVYLYKHG